MCQCTRLRKLIVALAVSNRLLARDVDVEQSSFSQIVKLIDARKRELIERGELKKERPRLVVTSEELPISSMNSERFVRLGSVARVEKGPTGIQKSSSGAFPLVVTAEQRASCDHFDFDAAAAIVPLVSSTGHGKASLHRLHYQEGKFALGGILAAIFPHAPELVSARFLFEYLTAFKEELLVSKMIGTANVSLSVGKIADVPVPLLDQSVQQRVDELMALCDRLEAARNERESRRDRLVAASMHRLGQPADDEAFRADARFTFNHLPRLTTRPEHVKQLRQTILNLAVRGRLVPQDPNDEPASEVLRRIAIERAQLENAGAMRKPKRASAIEQGEPSFDAPRGWVWSRLLEASRKIHYGFTASANLAIDNVRMLRITDIQDNKVEWSSVPGCEIDKKLLPHFKLEKGDILIARSWRNDWQIFSDQRIASHCSFRILSHPSTRFA